MHKKLFLVYDLSTSQKAKMDIMDLLSSGRWFYIVLRYKNRALNVLWAQFWQINIIICFPARKYSILYTFAAQIPKACFNENMLPLTLGKIGVLTKIQKYVHSNIERNTLLCKNCSCNSYHVLGVATPTNFWMGRGVKWCEMKFEMV